MKIRRVIQKTGWRGWQVDFGQVTQPDGSRKRVQKSFATQASAQKALDAARKEIPMFMALRVRRV